MSEPITLSKSSKILILTVGNESRDLLTAIKSILNQLIYAKKHKFIPVVYFDPEETDQPSVKNTPINNNQWEQYFHSPNELNYSEMLAMVEDPLHPLSKDNLFYLDQREVEYLNFGSPNSIYTYPYGRYSELNGIESDWRVSNRLKAVILLENEVLIKEEVVKTAAGYIEATFGKAEVLGLVIEDSDGYAPEFKLSIDPYLDQIKDFLNKNNNGRILLITNRQDLSNQLLNRFGDSIHQPTKKHNKESELLNALMLSQCNLLITNHSDTGAFATYFNKNLAFIDVSTAFQKVNPVILSLKKSFYRWKDFFRLIKQNARAIKTILKLVLRSNPITESVFQWVEKQRFSKYAMLRWITQRSDYIRLKIGGGVPDVKKLIKSRAKHSKRVIGSNYYAYEHSTKQKYLEIRNDWDTNTGFFAYYLSALEQLKYAEFRGLIPIVNFDEPFNFYREKGYNENMWENYFEPMAEVSSSQLASLASEELTFLDPIVQNRLGEQFDPPNDSWASSKHWWHHIRGDAARLTQKYVRVKPSILKMVDEYYQRYMSQHRVLGIHVRGTDKETDNHGNQYVEIDRLSKIIAPAKYFPSVDKYIQCYPDCKIFVATDQVQYLDQFIERYNSRVLFTNAKRSTSKMSVHKKYKGRFATGLEVLSDSLLLSRCDYLMKCMSAVGEVAICFNPSMPVQEMVFDHEVEELDFFNPEPAVPHVILNNSIA